MTPQQLARFHAAVAQFRFPSALAQIASLRANLAMMQAYRGHVIGGAVYPLPMSELNLLRQRFAKALRAF